MLKEYFEDCKVGDRVVTPGRTITETDLVLFAAFSSDWNAIHTDREFAAQSPFGQRIAHGLLGLVTGFCLLSRGGWFHFWPASLVCITRLDKIRFLAPVFIGDTIRLDAEIVEMTRMREGNGLITSRMQVRNQRNEMVIAGRIQLQAGCRPADGCSDQGRQP